MRQPLQLSLLALFVLVRPAVTPAHADLVFFTSGQTMSVAGQRIDGASIVLSLRNGGEVICDRSLVERIGPDEVPYPAPLSSEAANPRRSGKPYAEIIERVSTLHGVDPALVHALIEIESGYRPRARSPRGAMGLMQLMPATARRYSVTDPFDPHANIEAGTQHLKTLLDQFEVPHALAAYNAGAASVRRFGGIPPYRETQAYVARILQLVDAVSTE